MTVSISGAIDFLQDKYVLSPALQGPVNQLQHHRRRRHWGVCGFLFGNEAQRDSRLS